jgi:hypothetical protein
MNEMLKHFWKNNAGSLVRAALVFIGAWLVRKGLATGEQADAFVRDAEPFAVGLLLALGAYAWSVVRNWRVNKKVDAALEMPKGTPRAVLEKNV